MSGLSMLWVVVLLLLLLCVEIVVTAPSFLRNKEGVPRVALFPRVIEDVSVPSIEDPSVAPSKIVLTAKDKLLRDAYLGIQDYDVYDDIFRISKRFLDLNEYFSATMPGFSTSGFVKNAYTLPDSFVKFYQSHTSYYGDSLKAEDSAYNIQNNSAASLGYDYTTMLKQKIDEAKTKLGNEDDTKPSNPPSNVYLDNRLCERYIFSGDLHVAGNLKVFGKLDVVSGFNALKTLHADASQHLRDRCFIKEPNMYHIDGDLSVPSSNMLIVGDVYVGGNVIAGDLTLDAGSKLIAGFRGLIRSVSILTPESNNDNEPVNYDVFNAQKGTLKDNSDILNLERWFVTDFKEASNKTKKISKPTIELKCLMLNELGSPDKDSLPSDGIGEVITVKMSLHNSTKLIAYGNIRSERGGIIDGASSLTSICGHIQSDKDKGLGYVVVDGSILTSNGIGDNTIKQLTLQDAGIISLNGSLAVSNAIQVDEASVILVSKNIEAGAIAIDDQSQVHIGGDLVVNDSIECIDAGMLKVKGITVVGSLQIFDSAFVAIEKGLYVESFLNLDNDATLNVSGMITTEIIRKKRPNFQPHSELVKTKISRKLQPKSEKPSNHLIDEENDRLENSENTPPTTQSLGLVADQFSIYSERSINVSSSSTLNSAGNICSAKSLKLVNSTVTVLDSLYLLQNLLIGQKSIFKANGSVTVRGYLLAEDDEKENLTAQPALYIENSLVTINSKLTTFHTWCEMTKGAELFVSAPVRFYEGLIVVDGGSQLRAAQQLIVDKSIVIERNSSIDAQNITAAALRLTAASYLNTATIIISGNGMLEGRSELRASHFAEFQGSLLYVDEASKLISKAVNTTKGDIFVEDRGIVKSTQFDIIGAGSIVCQDRGTVQSARSIISQNGDIISENFGFIQAVTELSAMKGNVRRTPEAFIEFGSSRNEGVQVFLQDVPEVYKWGMEKNAINPVLPAVATKPGEQFVSSRRWQKRS